MVRVDASHGGPDSPAVGELPLATRLAELCARLGWDGLAPSVQQRTRELVLDHVAVTLAGRSAPSTSAVHAFLDRMAADGRASVLGRESPTTAEWAALANGTAAHAIEMDDCTRESSLHPGVAVIPAALGVAEELGLATRRLLEAIVVGYEVTIRVGAALNPASAYARGFHPTGVAGIFGAAAAVGTLLELDPYRMASALGIAGTMASGSLEYLSGGAWTKRLTPGWVGHGGVVASKLAAAGFEGPATVFEGPLGFFHAYSDAPRPERVLADEAEPMIMRVALKPYACCRYIHGLVDSVFELRNRFSLSSADVVSMELGVLSLSTKLVSDPIVEKRRPRSVVDAQFSAPFAAALALVRGSVGVDDVTDDALRDPEVRRLMSISDCFTDPDLDRAFPDGMPGVVRVTTRDGRTLEARVDHPSGEPENPLSAAALHERFDTLTRHVIEPSAASQLAERLMREDGFRTTTSLTDAIREAASSTR